MPSRVTTARAPSAMSLWEWLASPWLCTAGAIVLDAPLELQLALGLLASAMTLAAAWRCRAAGREIPMPHPAIGPALMVLGVAAIFTPVGWPGLALILAGAFVSAARELP